MVTFSTHLIQFYLIEQRYVYSNNASDAVVYLNPRTRRYLSIPLTSEMLKDTDIVALFNDACDWELERNSLISKRILQSCI